MTANTFLEDTPKHRSEKKKKDRERETSFLVKLFWNILEVKHQNGSLLMDSFLIMAETALSQAVYAPPKWSLYVWPWKHK